MGAGSRKPNLHSELMVKGEPEMQSLLRQLNERHGVGEVVPTSKGRHAGLQLNEETGQLEINAGAGWKALGGQESGVRSQESGGSSQESGGVPVPQAANQQVAGDLAVGGSIAVGGPVDGVDVSAHDHSGAGEGGTVIAGSIANTPAGTIAATDVQAAINELDTEKFAKSGGSLTGDVDTADDLFMINGRIYFGAATPTDAYLTVQGGRVGASVFVPNILDLIVHVVDDNYTVTTTSDCCIVCNKATAMTVLLPDSLGLGRLVMIKNVGAGVVTVDGYGTETIDGATTIALAQWESAILVDYYDGLWARM